MSAETAKLEHPPADATTNSGYQPTVSTEYAETLRRWHESAYEGLKQATGTRVTYLGLDLLVPEHVFAPAPMSELLGKAVLDEVKPTDRVLDMGTGTGVNAILAASRAVDVLGVDINPHAALAAKVNAETNGVSDRTTFAHRATCS